MGEPTAWMWPDVEVAISRSGRCQATHGAVQPVGDGSQGVVVERVHLARIDRAVREQAVPALPDGGGSHRHRIEPRWAFALREQVEGGVVLPDAAQRITDERRPHKAGADVVSALAHECGQPFARMPTLFSSLEQTKLQGQRIGGLGVAEHAPGGRDVLGIEGVAYLCGQLQVVGFLLGSAEDACGLPEQFG